VVEGKRNLLSYLFQRALSKRCVGRITASVLLSRLGKKGGMAWASNMTAEEPSESARNAAAATKVIPFGCSRPLYH